MDMDINAEMDKDEYMGVDMTYTLKWTLAWK
jgi:hypothetical protein